MMGAFYFNAYQELSTCRQYDGARIPWNSVIDYGWFYGMTINEIEDLFMVVSLLDQDIREAQTKPKKKLDRDEAKRKRIGHGT